MINGISRLALAAMLIAIVAGVARAQPLPPEITAQISSEVQASRAMAQREMALANNLGNPQLAATMQRKARQRADARLASAVVSIIATNQHLADQVLASAVAQAPESRGTIVASAQRSFPTLLGAPQPQLGTPSSYLAAAPIGAPPPAPIGAPAPAPAPFVEVPVVPVVDDGLPEPEIDPLETVNRWIFAFNDTVDTLIFRPIATVYGYLTPNPAKQWVRNFFRNLNEPVVVANDLLQTDWADAWTATKRFAVNTTLGMGGFFNVAEDFGLDDHTADFGQTMHSYGVGQGFFVMVPVIGPTTVRDGVGTFVDSFLDPLSYVFEFPESLIISGAEGIVTRENLLVPLDDLRENSIDFYAAVRGAYYQDRAVGLRKGRGDGGAAAVDSLFDALE